MDSSATAQPAGDGGGGKQRRRKAAAAESSGSQRVGCHSRSVLIFGVVVSSARLVSFSHRGFRQSPTCTALHSTGRVGPTPHSTATAYRTLWLLFDSSSTAATDWVPKRRRKAAKTHQHRGALLLLLLLVSLLHLFIAWRFGWSSGWPDFTQRQLPQSKRRPFARLPPCAPVLGSVRFWLRRDHLRCKCPVKKFAGIHPGRSIRSRFRRPKRLPVAQSAKTLPATLVPDSDGRPSDSDRPTTLTGRDLIRAVIPGRRNPHQSVVGVLSKEVSSPFTPFFHCIRTHWPRSSVTRTPAPPFI